MSKDTGGPAFPAEEWNDTVDSRVVNPIRHQGMTLRDYFAAMAMQGMLAGNKRPSERLTTHSYRYADAMLEAREVNEAPSP